VSVAWNLGFADQVISQKELRLPAGGIWCLIRQKNAERPPDPVKFSLAQNGMSVSSQQPQAETVRLDCRQRPRDLAAARDACKTVGFQGMKALDTPMTCL
jgi:hypothetical protein